MTNSISLIDAHSRNMSLRYSVESNSLFFTVTRFDGANFRNFPVSNDQLTKELENRFIELIDLFDAG